MVDQWWGPYILTVLLSANRGCRLVQVGNSAGADSMLTAAVWRNRLMVLTGMSIFLADAESRRRAYAGLMDLVQQPRFALPLEPFPLESMEEARQAWRRPGSKKVVVEP